MGFIMWNALKGQGGAQGVDWNGTVLTLGSAGSTFTVASADLVTMLIFVLDTSVQKEGGGNSDAFVRARNAIGGAAGASYSGHTASSTANRGVVLTNTGSGNTFDVGNALPFAVAVASLCQEVIPSVSGQLMRA